MRELIQKRLYESIQLKQMVLQDEELLDKVFALSQEICAAIRADGKIVLCGNGGSAADAMHFAGELTGYFQKDRPAWPALALNTDIVSLTAISNDSGYSNVFARQTEGYVHSGDIFIGISTSGNSENVLRAIQIANRKGAITAALLGGDGGRICPLVKYSIIVPSNVAARVQECHITLLHILCELIEDEMVKE